MRRTTLASLEGFQAPVRYDVGLRFCRQFIVSEEWLATGKHTLLKKAAITRGTISESDCGKLSMLFRRQAVDLLSEPIFHKIPPGSLLSEAFDHYLAPRYADLCGQSFYEPRIILTQTDSPQFMTNYLAVLVELWLLILKNRAIALGKDANLAQRGFLLALHLIGTVALAKFAGIDFPEVPETIEAHLRADRTLPPSTIEALSEMIRVAYKASREGGFKTWAETWQEDIRGLPNRETF